MDIRFRWNMFITSFLPLWAAIVISDLYDISGYIICRWGRLRAPSFDMRGAASRFMCINGLMVGTVMVVTIVVIASIWDLNRFLKTKESEVAPPIGILRRVRKANKLSAEYLNTSFSSRSREEVRLITVNVSSIRSFRDWRSASRVASSLEKEIRSGGWMSGSYPVHIAFFVPSPHVDNVAHLAFDGLDGAGLIHDLNVHGDSQLRVQLQDPSWGGRRLDRQRGRQR